MTNHGDGAGHGGGGKACLTGCALFMGLLVLAGVLAVWWAASSTERGPASAPDPAAPAARPPENAVHLVFTYGSEKKKWIADVTHAFNLAEHAVKSGKPIFVEQIPLGSGESMDELLEARRKAHLTSPASAAFIKLANAESEARFGKPLIAETENLVLSPVVIAMWKPMAEALGWGKKPLGWTQIIEMVNASEGWAAHGHPEWGSFKFGHTHPEYSNSGLISLFAEVYAGAGKTRNLTLADVNKPETAEYLRSIEIGVVHYGSSTGFFGRKMFANGPSYLSAAVLYENMVIESYSHNPPLELPLVAIYPKEGTFWSDHPVGIVERDWVTPEHREAAETYIDYLLAPERQTKALQYGFRPADPQLTVGDPVNAAHGVDPKEPSTTLEVPAPEVMNAVIELWKKNKKHANIVLVLDTSGSMRNNQRLTHAKIGAKAMLDLLGEEDFVTFVPFNDQVRIADAKTPMKTGRETLNRRIDGLFAGGGTALYDAVHQAFRHLMENRTPELISAVVVLTDGKDENSTMGFEQLLREIRSDNEQRSIRVFTIGYGSGAEADKLEAIAEATQAKYYAGTPETIREVFKSISTFF